MARINTLDRVAEFKSKLLSTYWFVPALMSAGAVATAFLMLYLDQHYYADVDIPWVYINSPDGARSVLSAIAGSVITVAGVAFSVTIVALTVAASQYGPHVLSNLMRDRGNQVVLGTFTSTYLYCLLVLRTIHGGSDSFAFALSIVLAVLMAMASIAVLIYFIHHISTMLRVESVLGRMSQDFRAAIDVMYPERVGDQKPQPPANWQSIETTGMIHVQEGGYLQSIRPEELLELAIEFQTVIILLRRPGDYLIPSEELAAVGDVGPDKLKLLEHKINAVMQTGQNRTSDQDVRYPAVQLTNVALHALSPALNDSLTARACINELAVGLSALSRRQYPDSRRRDTDGNIRIIAESVRVDELLELTLGEIIPLASKHFTLSLRLFEVLDTLLLDPLDPRSIPTIKRLSNDLYLMGSKHLEREYHRQALKQRRDEIIGRIGNYETLLNVAGAA